MLHSDDLDWDYIPEDASVIYDAENRASLDKTLRRLRNRIDVLHPPRPGKKLLVLDLDYTLFDCKATSLEVVTDGDSTESAPSGSSNSSTTFSVPISQPRDALRPGTHEFLTAMHEHYDLAVWSQTSRRTLHLKLTALGMLDHPNYRLVFFLDRSTMFSIQNPKKSSSSKSSPDRHEVKALEIIWSCLGDSYHQGNTVHVDDLGRNVAMNPNHGGMKHLNTSALVTQPSSQGKAL